MSNPSFELVYSMVAQDANYQPRPYVTMGGMWTVDTWQRDDVTAQLMDEGWSRRLRAPGLDVSQSGMNPVQFREGTQQLLQELAARLAEKTA